MIIILLLQKHYTPLEKQDPSWYPTLLFPDMSPAKFINYLCMLFELQTKVIEMFVMSVMLPESFCNMFTIVRSIQ